MYQSEFNVQVTCLKKNKHQHVYYTYGNRYATKITAINRNVPNISPALIEVYKQFLVSLSKCRGSIYLLSMFIHYPNNTQNPKCSSWASILRDYIRKDIWVYLQGGLYSEDLHSGVYVSDFTVYEI